MKFVLNAAINPVCAVTGLRPGEIVRIEPARRLLERAARRDPRGGRGEGHPPALRRPRAEILDHAWERYNRPSMLQHVEGGRRTEIDALNGALLREAAAVGIACPFNEAIVHDDQGDRGAVRAFAPPPPILDEAALEAAARASPRPRREPRR